jgi:hypothetical protein
VTSTEPAIREKDERGGMAGVLSPGADDSETG